MWSGILKKYSPYLPMFDGMKFISLNEGNTPLIRAESLSKKYAIDLYLKFEGANPTGSFKDRGMAAAVTEAHSKGVKTIICASTGNTAAAAAAYGARASMDVYVMIPSGKIALGKLSQALIHGAKVLAIDGNFDEALSLVQKIAERDSIGLVNSINPYRIEGQKTASFEICDDLGRAPHMVALPVGNAGNITSYWKGFNEYYEHGEIKERPQMIGFQAAGSAPIVEGHPISSPKTIASAIRIGHPARWKDATKALEESRGFIDSVTDEEILAAYRLLAKEEGIFCEPASASSIAGIQKSIERGVIKRGSLLVAILTGHGLKDPGTTMDTISHPKTLQPDLEVLLKEMNLQSIAGGR